MTVGESIRRRLAANPTGALVALLAAIGAGVGYMLGNLTIGLASGAMIGAAIGSHVYRRRRRQPTDTPD
ncbi:hypothetical protein BH09PSE6_BH09PSE6_28760 [soil metagenome]